MKSGEKALAWPAVTEHIEMELLSPEDPRVGTSRQEEDEREEEHSFVQKPQEPPLVPDGKEKPTPGVQTHPRRQNRLKTEPPARQVSGHYASVLSPMEKIEMKVFPPLTVPESDSAALKSDDPPIMTPPSPNKSSRLRWKRISPQRMGLVVKDVICLPTTGHYKAHLERCVVPNSKEREALSAMGMTARLTIDCGWSADQVLSRLVMLFWSGQRFSLTYLQCVQGSRVLFVPDSPAEGWTGEQVLRICGHGPLYVSSQLHHPQAGSGSSGRGSRFCLEAESLDGDDPVGEQTPEENVPLDLETVLRLFRQRIVDSDVKTRIVVRRRNMLRDALNAVRRSDFCVRKTPIISFSGEETRGHKGPLREFFRLTLLELEHSPVFEGPPGRLFLTHDLTALKDRKYYEAGVLIGWSLAHGGPGPRCLHPALYQLMCGHTASLDDFVWTDVVDAEAQTHLQQLHSCTDVKLLSPSVLDWVSSSGIPGVSSAGLEDIPAIYKNLVTHYIYHRVARMVSQFKEGLNSCGGLWDTIQNHWELFLPVMTGAQQQPPTLEEFKQLFTVCYSRSDAQLRASEEATVAHWETVLSWISDGRTSFSFGDLLTFITGAERPPPLGATGLIALRFYSQDAGTSTSGLRLPQASTCALELLLPRGSAAAADLLALLSRAVSERGSSDRTD